MPRRFRSRRAVIILVAVLLVAAGAGFTWMRMRGERPTAVQTEEVRRGEVIETVAATGRVQPQSEVKISANVSGRIERLAVEEGDSVSQGQLLVEIDPMRYQALVRESEAGLRSARAEERLEAANLDQAKREYERRLRVHAQGLSSAGDIENAETTLKVSEARLDAAREAVQRAQALLAQTRDDLSKTTITAPMAGIITRVNVEAGEMVLGTAQNVGTTIMTLADLNQMEILADVDESEVIKLALGDSTTIEVDALSDHPYRGLVSEIAHSATTRGRGTAEEATHFEVKVAVLGDVTALRPGMTATVDVLTDRREGVLHLPIQCVTLRSKEGDAWEGSEDDEREEASRRRNRGGGDASADDRPEGEEESRWEDGRRQGRGLASNLREVVYVVRDGKAHEVPVETGISSPTEIEITGGEVNEGDEVVAGSYRVLSRELEDGERVKVDNRSLRRNRREGDSQHAAKDEAKNGEAKTGAGAREGENRTGAGATGEHDGQGSQNPNAAGQESTAGEGSGGAPGDDG
jgi:HlyD family secretion protein